jgi:hypothetical protein
MYPLANMQTGGSRKPRLRAIAENGQMLGVLSARLVSTDNLTSDRFYLTAVLPKTMAEGRALWSNLSRLTIDIQISSDENASFQTVIQGPIDSVGLDPIRNIIDICERNRHTPRIFARSHSERNIIHKLNGAGRSQRTCSNEPSQAHADCD